MATRKEMTKINRIVEIIKNNSPISRVHLVMQSGISISYFEKLKPFVEEIYSTKVRWDKETKLWYFIESKTIESPEIN